MAAKSQIEIVDEETKAAFLMWMSIMDDFTGGVFKQGWRPASPVERVREWDALLPEHIEQLRQAKGNEWVNQQGAEIDKLRLEVDRLKGYE